MNDQCVTHTMKLLHNKNFKVGSQVTRYVIVKPYNLTTTVAILDYFYNREGHPFSWNQLGYHGERKLIDHSAFLSSIYLFILLVIQSTNIYQILAICQVLCWVEGRRGGTKTEVVTAFLERVPSTGEMKTWIVTRSLWGQHLWQ